MQNISPAELFKNLKKSFERQTEVYTVSYANYAETGAPQETYTVSDDTMIYGYEFNISRNINDDSFEIWFQNKNLPSITQMDVPKKELEQFFYNRVASWYLIKPILDKLNNDIITSQYMSIEPQSNGILEGYKLGNGYTIMRTRTGQYALMLPPDAKGEEILLTEENTPKSQLRWIYTNVEEKLKCWEILQRLTSDPVQLQQKSDEIFENYIVKSDDGNQLFTISRSKYGPISLVLPVPGTSSTLTITDDLDKNIPEIFRIARQKYKGKGLGMPLMPNGRRM